MRRWHPGQRWLCQPGGLGVFDPGINALSILTALLPVTPGVVRADLHIPANAHTPIAAAMTLQAGDALIGVDLDFLESTTQQWDIHLRTRCGHSLHLGEGGATLSIDEMAPERGESHEYPALYACFARRLAERRSDADAAPLALVEQALAIGTTHRADPFIE